MQKQAPTFGRLLVMVLFALSCFGLLLFLWLSLRRPGAAEAQGLPRQGRVPRGHAARRRRPTCASPACRSARCASKDARPEQPQPHARDARDRPQVRADRRGRAGDPAPEDAARRDLRRAHAGHRRTRPTVPEDGAAGRRAASPTVELDEIFQAFDPQTRRAFRDLAAGRWRTAIDGRGQDLNDAFGNLPAFVARRHRRARACSTTRRRRSRAWCATPASCSTR